MATAWCAAAAESVLWERGEGARILAQASAPTGVGINPAPDTLVSGRVKRGCLLGWIPHGAARALLEEPLKCLKSHLEAEPLWHSRLWRNKAGAMGKGHVLVSAEQQASLATPHLGTEHNGWCLKP